jgi:hypothetical protein
VRQIEIRLNWFHPENGYTFGYGNVFTTSKYIGAEDEEVPVILDDMFHKRQKLEPRIRDPLGQPAWRALSLKGNATFAVRILERDFYQQFMKLPTEIARGTEVGERAILRIANRYGLLRGRHFETVAYWARKSQEMREATRRRDAGRLRRLHFDCIQKYIGPLDPIVEGLSGRAGTISVTYSVRSLFAALWLQWAQSVVRYQGDCEWCGAPLIGNRGKRSCDDYCRKQLSLERRR